jgi:UDP-glucuronate decarboxylase
MGKILIVGGSGFVGSSLSDLLTVSAHESVVFTSTGFRVPSNFNPHGQNFSHVSWNVLNRSDLNPDFDLIIHAATPASAQLNNNNPKDMFDVIVQGMENVIEFASRHPKLPTVLFTSSGAVYDGVGDLNENIEESSIITPNSVGSPSAYSEGKRSAELMLKEASDAGICKGIIARLFAFSGKNLPRDRHFAIGNFVEDAVTKKKIIIRGDGSSIRSYLDQWDMAQWMLTIANHGDPSHIYHVGSERAISIVNLATLISQRYELITGEIVPIEILGQSSPLDGVSRYVPSTAQTRKELGLSETISLESSIDSMLEAAILQFS